MKRFFTATLLALVLGSVCQAGPIRNAIAARREVKQATCQAMTQPAAIHRVGFFGRLLDRRSSHAVEVTTPAATSQVCASGSCPLPKK